jgi:2'-5' RNA ligase
MRCFIALDLPREVINSIKEIQKLIKKKKLFDGKI